jgi:hypothetical protein
MREDKFNVITVTSIMILINLFLLPIFVEYSLYRNFFYLLVYEGSIIVGLLFGLRGQGRYKNMMINLQNIARNKDLDVNERDARLVSMIHHACLELGYIYEERNEDLGLNFKKKLKKKTKEVG